MFTNRMVPKLTALIDGFYPDDLRDYMQNRVHISLTNIDSKLKMRNELKSTFASRQECLDTIVASCLVPAWGGYRYFFVFSLLQILFEEYFESFFKIFLEFFPPQK